MLVHRIGTGVDRMPWRRALHVATSGGARVLGRDDIGSLEPGKCADIAVFDVSGIEYAGAMHDPVGALFFCGGSSRAHTVVVNGRVVVESGRLVAVDESEVVRRANMIAARMLS
jgi:cytosine/adenosine deaminase-related metal-dependent hydrolase